MLSLGQNCICFNLFFKKQTHSCFDTTHQLFFTKNAEKLRKSLFTDRPLALNWVLCCVYLRSWETLAAAAGSTRRDTRWAFCTVSNAGVATSVFYSVHTVLKISVANLTTVWKFQHFSMIQMLIEINFGECRSSENAGVTIYQKWFHVKPEW